ncbi:MAG: hypothetical protein AB1894_09390 [Chloroflexota bacterium]
MLKHRFSLFLLFGLLLLGLPWRGALAAPPGVTIPPGFELLLSAEGAELYQKDYPNGSPDYVQVLDLRAGARVRLQYAQVIEPRPNKGVYGGADPRFSLQPLAMFWRQAVAEHPNTFCVANGGFFYMPEAPTRLAFPLKVDGQVISDGWAIEQYPEQKLMLELWGERADITPLTQEALYGSSAPDILAGLTEEANKRAKYAVGRTFVGLADGNGDGAFEIFLMLNTATAVQSEVASVLRDFGAEKVMMLDGGGSAQLTCQGEGYLKSERLIPQALAMRAASPARTAARPTALPTPAEVNPPVSASAAGAPPWLVLVAGDPLELEFTLTNTGSQVWLPEEQRFVLEKNPLGAQQALAFERPVESGGQAQFSLQLGGYAEPGIYSLPLRWHIAAGEQVYPGDPALLRVVALPVEMAARRGELESLLKSWAGLGEAQIETNVEDWLDQSEEALPPAEAAPPTDAIQPAAAQPATPDAVHLRDLLWIPLLMLPFIFLVMSLVANAQQSAYRD